MSCFIGAGAGRFSRKSPNPSGRKKSGGVVLERERPSSWGDCFTFDASPWNPTPRGWPRRGAMIFLSARYSMTVLMRLAQFCHGKSRELGGWAAAVHEKLALALRRLNEVLNDFEHGADPRVGRGVVFHHRGVCLTSGAIVEPEVHFYRHVLLGTRNGGAPRVKRGAKIASHAVVLGPVTIGSRAVVAPGAVVISDVPDGKVAAGVPGKIVADVTPENYEF